jgi:hypothetical protein
MMMMMMRRRRKLIAKLISTFLYLAFSVEGHPCHHPMVDPKQE